MAKSLLFGFGAKAAPNDLSNTLRNWTRQSPRALAPRRRILAPGRESKTSRQAERDPLMEKISRSEVALRIEKAPHANVDIHMFVDKRTGAVIDQWRVRRRSPKTVQ